MLSEKEDRLPTPKRGEDNTDRKMRLEDALDGYWLARKRDFSPNTVNDYQRTFTRFCEFVGADKPIEEISSGEIHDFLNHAQKRYRLGKKTLTNVWIALSSFWSWAERELDIEHIIRKRVPQPRFRRQPVEAFTEDDVRRLLASCDYNDSWRTKWGRNARTKRPTALRDRAIMLTLLDSGLRASELAGLRMSDFDKDRGQLMIRHGKGDKRRVVYLGDSARKALWKYMTTRVGVRADDPIFITRTGRPMDRMNVCHMIERAGKRTGIHAFPHKFRHTFAITFLRNGGNLLTLQQILGHESLDTVRNYANIAAVDIENALRIASPVDNWRL